MARKRSKRTTRKSFFLWRMLGWTAPLGLFIIRKSAWILLCVGIGAGVMALKTHCQDDPSFAIARIMVNETHYLSHDELLRLAQIKTGINMFHVDLSAIANRLERVPRIKKAEVVRSFPQTLTLTITERKDTAQITFPNSNRWYVIGEDGRVVAAALSAPREDLPIIEIRYGIQRTLAAGESCMTPALDRALRVLASVPHHASLRNEKKVSLIIDSLENISVLLHDGIEILVGKQFETALEKLDKVAHILSGDDRMRMKYIDVRFKDVVVKNK